MRDHGSLTDGTKLPVKDDMMFGAYPRHWTCEVTLLRLEAYLRRTLPLAESLAVAEHLQACDSCAHLLTLGVERRPGPSGSERSAGEPRD